MTEDARNSSRKSEMPENSRKSSRKSETPENSRKSSRKSETPEDSRRSTRKSEMPEDSRRSTRRSERPWEEQDFNYEDPEHWSTKFPDCGGKNQSPVAINSHTAETIDLPELKFSHYDEPIAGPVKAVNNGETVVIDISTTTEGNRPSVSGGVINDTDTYEVQNFHFHWGSPTSKGAEHTIDNIEQDMELHIVHKNHKYPTMGEAFSKPDGILVLGILIAKVANKRVENYGRQHVYDALTKLSMYNSAVVIDGTITMESILGDLDTSRFYTYHGSTTAPPCNEAVTWFVFQQVLEIETRYVSIRTGFFGLHDDHGNPVLDNHRPIQPLGKRKIYKRKNP